MRSALIILCTLLVVALGFGGYLLFQKSAPQHALPPALTGRAARPASAPANPNIPVTSGENVFVETYDKDTNQLASRFRAAEYDPQPDGTTVNVTKPEAEFYLDKGNGRVLRLRGATGQVIVPNKPGGAGAASAGRGTMPTRGKLHDVVLMLYPTKTARKPSLTCRMNNASFDTDTFRITTDAFTDPKSGREIPADEVPVQVRGDDYDFDGRGLTIHWDEKDRRLQLLEIAHGQKLIIKHPGAFGGGNEPAPAPHTRGEGRGEGPSSFAEAVASADNRAPLPAPTTRRRRPTTRPSAASTRPAKSRLHPNPTSRPATRPAPAPHVPAPYRAVFFDNVRVMQGNQQVAQADLMNVDFLMNNEESSDRSPTTEPTTGPTTRRSTTRQARRVATTAPATATAPATQPNEQPMTVLWTGKLRVTPPPPEVEIIQPGDSVVELVGEKNPVLLHWQGSNVTCASVQWHTLDDSAIVRSSDLVPLIRMDDPRGMTLLTPAIEYSGAEHIAITEGKSHADLPLQRNGPATQPAEIAHVDWTDSCTMLMSPGATKQDTAIEHVRLDGDVSVDSSQLKLKSRQLDLVLDPEAQRKKKDDGSTEMAVKQVIATDSVHAIVSDAQKKDQIIDCQHLAADLDKTSDGRAYLHVLNADGEVHTASADGELNCGHLQATMIPAPATQPATLPTTQLATSMPADFSTQVQIETLYASDNVRGKSADGRMIEGEHVTITQTDTGPQYQIAAGVGAPSPTTSPARVGDGTNTIAGPNIVLTPRIGKADVIGEGSMHGVQQSSSSPKQSGQSPSTQPIDVSWQKQLNADMKANEVRILGGVSATSKLDDGSTNIAHGDLLIMGLADAPATQPSTKPAKHSPATAPAGGMLGDADFALFRNKVVKTVTLKSESDSPVEVRSTLLAADGSLERRINLFAPVLIYEMETRSLTVPMPGRLLYQDERGATTTQPASAPTPAPASQPVGPLGDTKGAMAFKWTKDFVYDDANRSATMRGDVLLVHQTPTGAEAYRMNAQKVTAEMQPEEPKDPKTPTTRKASDLSAGAKVKKLVADGSIVFNSQRLQFLAEHIEFDPTAQQLIARGGGDNAPAVLLDTNGLSQGTFSEMYYDTAKDQMRLVNFRAAIRR